MRYVFMINPVAGRGEKYKNLIDRINTYFDLHPGEYKIVVSTYAGEIKEKSTQEAQTGEEVTIFACGGEGTCFEVLNGVAEYGNVTIGVIPIGSANDFLKFFGNENKELFMDISTLIEGTAVSVDAVKADEFYCINGCSAGMDAVVARDMSIFKNWPFVSGSLAYKLAIVKTFLSKIGVEIEVTIDGVTKSKKNCLFAVVGNGPVYGGGYHATPDADPFDSILDFTIVDTISKLRVPAFLKKYETGQHACFNYCTLGKCKTMSFKADKPIPVNLDGEIFERSEMHFEILPEKIRFCLPTALAEKYCKIVKKM